MSLEEQSFQSVGPRPSAAALLLQQTNIPNPGGEKCSPITGESPGVAADPVPSGEEAEDEVAKVGSPEPDPSVRAVLPAACVSTHGGGGAAVLRHRSDAPSGARSGGLLSCSPVHSVGRGPSRGRTLRARPGGPGVAAVPALRPCLASRAPAAASGTLLARAGVPPSPRLASPAGAGDRRAPQGTARRAVGEEESGARVPGDRAGRRGGGRTAQWAAAGRAEAGAGTCQRKRGCGEAGRGRGAAEGEDAAGEPDRGSGPPRRADSRAPSRAASGSFPEAPRRRTPWRAPSGNSPGRAAC